MFGFPDLLVGCYHEGLFLPEFINRVHEGEFGPGDTIKVDAQDRELMFG